MIFFIDNKVFYFEDYYIKALSHMVIKLEIQKNLFSLDSIHIVK